jgi:hypothetical protein
VCELYRRRRVCELLPDNRRRRVCELRAIAAGKLLLYEALSRC